MGLQRKRAALNIDRILSEAINFVIKSNILHNCIKPFLFWFGEDDDNLRYSLIESLGAFMICYG